MAETERLTVQIPKNTEVYKYLFEGKNHKNMAKWEIIEEMVRQLPQSKQERAYKLFCSFVSEMDILYPESKDDMMILWRLISKRIMKVPDLDGKEVYLDDFYYAELKKI